MVRGYNECRMGTGRTRDNVYSTSGFELLAVDVAGDMALGTRR